MTNVKKAIEILKERSLFIADINLDAQISYKLAIDALEKEIPKISGCDICNDTSNSRYYKNNKYRYCPYCGQKLEWGDN